jgi:hypothetical protein
LEIPSGSQGFSQGSPGQVHGHGHGSSGHSYGHGHGRERERDAAVPEIISSPRDGVGQQSGPNKVGSSPDAYQVRWHKSEQYFKVLLKIFFSMSLIHPFTWFVYLYVSS